MIFMHVAIKLSSKSNNFYDRINAMTSQMVLLRLS